MAPEYKQLNEISVPGKTSVYGNYLIEGASILSVGVQNDGWKTGIYSTQLFVANANRLSYQLDNTTDNAINVNLHVVTNAPVSSFTQTSEGSKSLS